MKKIESIILALCSIIFLQAESFSSDYLVFATPNNTIEVLDFKEFNPFIFVEDGEIVNKEKYNKNDFDWFHSFSLGTGANKATYKEWKQYATPRHIELSSEKSYNKAIESRLKVNKELLRNTITGFIKFKYLEKEYLMIRIYRYFIDKKDMQVNSTLSQFYLKENDKWLSAINLVNKDSIVDLFCCQQLSVIKKSINTKLYNKKGCQSRNNKEKEPAYPAKVVLVTKEHVFYENHLLLNINAKNHVVEIHEFKKKQPFWLENYCKMNKEKLEQIAMRGFFRFIHNEYQYIVIYDNKKNINLSTNLLVYDFKNNLVKLKREQIVVKQLLEKLLKVNLHVLKDIFENKIFSIDKNDKIISGF